MAALLKKLSRIFSPKPYQQEAHALYTALVQQSRQPVFYAEMGVADTLDGRFDMIALHVFIAIQRIKKTNAPETQELVRAVTEAFFADMDRNLREMGSSDTGVGKRIKAMSQAFYGRLQAYEAALGDDTRMKEALIRNVYRGNNADGATLNRLIDYINTTTA